MAATILDKIVAHKKTELEAQKRKVTLQQLLGTKRARPHYSLTNELLKPEASGIIAEFKRKSPSKDWINRQAKANVIPAGYEQAGASGVSILTDEHFFGGTLQDLILAAEMVKIPILRKEFIIDEYQVIEAAKTGADVVLLIAACLSPQQVVSLAQIAQENKLEVLLEIHDINELGHICNNVDFVGVNNRNLHTFETSLQTSVELANEIPEPYIKISESGLHKPQDILMLKKHGYRGFLMGENFMKTGHPDKECAQFIKKLC